MASVLRRVVAKFRPSPRARLMIEPPKSVTEGWLVRLRCQNPGAPGSFEATVVAIEPAPQTEAALPWRLAWRRNGQDGRVHLETRHGEILRLALFRPDDPSVFVMFVETPDGRIETRRVPSGAGVVATVRVRRGNRIDVEQRIRLATRENKQGEFVPIVTFDA
jgi:hypothetical protein